MQVLPKYPGADTAQVQEKFKELDWRMSQVEGKARDMEGKSNQHENRLGQQEGLIREQDQRQFLGETRLNQLESKLN